MATHVLTNPRWHKSEDGHGPRFRGLALGEVATVSSGMGEEPLLREEALQTFRVGDIVYLNAAGNVAIVTESTDTVDSAILGQAAKPGANAAAAGTPAYVQVWRPEDRFLMQVFHTTLSLAVTAQTQMSEVFPIIKDEAGNDTYHIDLVTTAESPTVTLARVMVVGFPEGDYINNVKSTLGDTYGWVIVKPLEFSLETTGDQALQRILQG